MLSPAQRMTNTDTEHHTPPPAMRAPSRTRQKRSRDEWIQWTQGLNIKCQPRDHSDCDYKHQAAAAWQLWCLMPWEETSSAERASPQPFPSCRGDTGGAAMPPTSHGSPEHAAATVTPQLPHGHAGTAGTKPCSTQSPPRGFGDKQLVLKPPSTQPAAYHF